MVSRRTMVERPPVWVRLQVVAPCDRVLHIFRVMERDLAAVWTGLF